MIRKLFKHQVATAATMAIFAIPAGARAQAASSTPSSGSVIVTPGQEYEAGPFKRLILGPGWRELWVTPINTPVLDLSKYAGGLKADAPGGGNQTKTLHFKEQSGWRDYLFRSVNKDPVGQAMPKELRGTPVGDIVQDQVSNLFPAGALLVPPFLEAIGALHVKPQIFVMPDDPALGKFQKEFAGMLGTIELNPQEAPDEQPGFAGSRSILNGDKFLELVEASRENVLDEREFFAVRLVDLMINDNDRTGDNTRFARFGEKGAYRWRPVPRDRDRVFVDARGLLVDYLIRPLYPKLFGFGTEYHLRGLVFESYQLDRRLLQRITRQDANDIALRVQKAVDDRVIDAAIAAMPAEWRSRTGEDERLRETLRARRDGLPLVATAFYEWLATEVDLHGTDEKERVDIERQANGSVMVTINGRDATSARPFFQRRFLPGETNEVRVYLHSGDDVAVVRGAPNEAIKIRLIGGKDADILADSAGGHATAFYDTDDDTRFLANRSTKVSKKDWKEPRKGAGVRFDAPWRPDWGKEKAFGPAFGYADGAGLIIGGGPRYKSYGFRRLPHKLEASANLLVGTFNQRLGLKANADYRLENSPLAMTFAGRATRLESFRFHGLGNDIDRQEKRSALVEQDLIAIEPAIERYIGWRSREDFNVIAKEDTAKKNDSTMKKSGGLRPLIGKMRFGPVFLWNRGDPRSGSPYALEQGDNAIARTGARAGLELDKTSEGPPSTSGWKLRTEIEGYPDALSNTGTFGTAFATSSAYIPLGISKTSLAFRAGGSIASESTPLQHAPYIGGGSTLRGYTTRRYAGDKAAFGSAEVRVPIGILPVLIKWNAGVFGLVDAGRVWLDGDSPGGWHKGYGGGIWLSALGQALSFAYAHGEENRFYVQKGLFF